MSKAATAAGKVAAMCQISDAMPVFELRAEGKVDNAVAAAAFDKRFGEDNRTPTGCALEEVMDGKDK